MPRKKKTTTEETAPEAPAQEAPPSTGRAQPDLPEIKGDGVALPDVPEINIAAERYLDVRNRRMELTKEEVEARAVLMQTMEDHALERYQFSDYVVIVEHGKSKLKVRTAVEDDGEPTEEVTITAEDEEGV